MRISTVKKWGAKHMLLLFLGSAWLTCLGWRPWHFSYFIDQQNGAKTWNNLCFSCTICFPKALCLLPDTHTIVCNWRLGNHQDTWTFIVLLFISQKYGIGFVCN